MKRRRTIRRANYGQGDLFDFHGAFTEKKAAVAKESATPGAFIRTIWYQGGPRYGVLTARNPRGRAILKRQRNFDPLTMLNALANVNSLVGVRKGKGKRKKNVEWGTYEKGVFHPWTRRTRLRRKPAKRVANSADTSYVHKALKVLYPGKSIKQLSVKQLSQLLMHAQELKAGKPSPKSNPSKRNYADATELYTKFHGRGPKGVKIVEGDYDGHPELGQLGRLVSLAIGGKVGGKDWRKKIEWGSREAPDLASEKNGKQLYLVGGSQNLDAYIASLPVKSNGSGKIDLGEAYQLEYFTQKGFDNFQPVTYYHDLGEETGVRPRVVYDRKKKRIRLVGGAYTVKPEGIVN